MADDKKKGDKSDKPDKPAKPAAAAKPKPAQAQKPAKARASADASGGDTATAGRPHAPATKPRLATFYLEKVRPALMQKFAYTSLMQAPRIQKIVLNMGVGDATQDAKLLDAAANELGQITGQRPAIRKAKKSIANFKLREGVAVGCAVTLRGARMWEFYDRFINVAVPRIRDFRGLNPRSFDGRGNYTMGLTEQIIFPEINLDKVGKIRGMDVTIVTSARTDEEGRELLRLMSMPFRQR
jgi:large subunit ribosomal protein L5